MADGYRAETYEERERCSETCTTTPRRVPRYAPWASDQLWEWGEVQRGSVQWIE